MLWTLGLCWGKPSCNCVSLMSKPIIVEMSAFIYSRVVFISSISHLCHLNVQVSSPSSIIKLWVPRSSTDVGGCRGFLRKFGCVVLRFVNRRTTHWLCHWRFRVVHVFAALHSCSMSCSWRIIRQTHVADSFYHTCTHALHFHSFLHMPSLFMNSSYWTPVSSLLRNSVKDTEPSWAEHLVHTVSLDASTNTTSRKGHM